MTDRDTFLREVDEAVRQDQYKQLWDRYGVYALGVAVLRGRRASPATRAGHYWQQKRAQDAGAQFSQALPGRKRRRREGARDAHRLAEPGRKAIACSPASSSPRPKPRPGKPTRPSPITMRSPRTRASIRSCKAMPRCKPPRSGSTRRTMPRWSGGSNLSSIPNSAWQFSARELLGLSAYRLNNMREAETAIQRAGRRSRDAAEFAGARRNDARADRGSAAGA